MPSIVSFGSPSADVRSSAYSKCAQETAYHGEQLVSKTDNSEWSGR